MKHLISYLPSFADNIPATHDLWILGDNFLREIFRSFEAMRTRGKKEKEEIPPYMEDYYNVKEFYKPVLAGEKYTMGRIINKLIEAINNRKRLPKTLIVVTDKDLVTDVINDETVKEDMIQHVLADNVRYLVRHIDTILKRKKLDFMNKKPGSVNGFVTTIIYVRMLRRIGSYGPTSKITKICEYRANYNNFLNDAVAKVRQRILTINACRAYKHFDRQGNLSSIGKEEFWMELDDLIDRFDVGKVKLRPNPKNPPKKQLKTKKRNYPPHEILPYFESQQRSNSEYMNDYQQNYHQEWYARQDRPSTSTTSYDEYYTTKNFDDYQRY